MKDGLRSEETATRVSHHRTNSGPVPREAVVVLAVAPAQHHVERKLSLRAREASRRGRPDATASPLQLQPGLLPGSTRPIERSSKAKSVTRGRVA